MSKSQRTYWYDYADIHHILTTKSNGQYAVIEAATTDQEQLTQRIDEAFRGLDDPISPDTAVIPINLGISRGGSWHGTHWVGIVIKKIGSTFQALYNDSFGTPMESSFPTIGDARFCTLKQILANHGVAEASIIDLHTKQQSNGYDCGPWTVLNLDSVARTGFLPAAAEINIIEHRREAFKEDMCPRDGASAGADMGDLNDIYVSALHRVDTIPTVDSADEKIKVLDAIKGSYEKGLEYYAAGNLELAEAEFAKTTRPVLSKTSMKSLYVNARDCKDELLGAMDHLGKIYLASDKYLDHHSKAAAIFQYCAGFARKYAIGDSEAFLQKAHDAEKAFLESVDKGESAASHIDGRQETAQHKKALERIRLDTKKKLDEIKDWPVERIAERSKAVEEIYKDCAKFFTNHSADKDEPYGLAQQLLESCVKQLGEPPAGCEYAIIGLGSFAGGRMTPWSDLEFAILISEDRADFKEYFRNLTKLLHIKIINIGETPLRTVGVEALNNFRAVNPADDWFWDR